MNPGQHHHGSNHTTLEQSPLRTSFLHSHNRFELIRVNEERLLIRNHSGVRWFAWTLAGLGLPVLLLGLMSLIGWFSKPAAGNLVAVGLFLLWGGVMYFMGVWLLGRYYRFDNTQGQLTISHFWRTRRLALSEIRSVQVIDAGWFQSGTSEQGGAKYQFPSYQLNLVLHDTREPRLFVAYNTDLTDIARKAQALAHFLQVPLATLKEAQATVQAYSKEDTDHLTREMDGARFRGNDSLRSRRDSHLSAPYDGWINRLQPLPADVHLFPRSVNLVFDLGMFLILGILFTTMPALMVMMFWPLFVQGEWGAIIPITLISMLLLSVPLLLLRRVYITLGAYVDRQRGILRQGILIGPEGMLVRMEPNLCYPISLDRLVQAKTETSSGSQGTSSMVIETLDGTVKFFSERIDTTPEQLNEHVSKRKK